MDGPKWSPPAVESAQGKAPSDTTRSSTPPGTLWAGRFIVCMACFGVVGVFFSSWFPISLGALLFFTDEDFIEWAFQSIGIRLVPDTLGSVFIKSFVFLIGWSILLVYWKDSAPEWLSSSLPSGAPPWLLIAGAALLIAGVTTASLAIMTNLLPEIARGSLPWTITRAVIALVMFGMLAIVIYAFRPLQARVSDELATRISCAAVSICTAPSTSRPRLS
jgi:hypothetical protein